MASTIGKLSLEFSKLAGLSHINRKLMIRKLAIDSFGNTDLALSLLSEFLLNISSNLQQVELSFNPNGFFKVTILRIGKTALRLHVKSSIVKMPNNARIEENIHDHRWSFVSILLIGSIQHELYGICQNYGESLHQYSYYPRGKNDYFSMNYHGTINTVDSLCSNKSKIT
jgi:hypothetical protein